MQVGPFQLLLARQQQIESGAAYIGALRSYWLARTRLDQILQGRLPSSEAATVESSSPSTPAGGRGGH
jgi:cobalt-zinc-cadmium efflux system outer membrane protein